MVCSGIAASVQPADSGQSSKKTIAITAEDSVSVDPEVATITVGYQNYASTKDAAYGENIRVSNEVTKALLNGGVPKSALETER